MFSSYFNASVSMESRVSTILAQNVALPIYVSIFYLPIRILCSKPSVPISKVPCYPISDSARLFHLIWILVDIRHSGLFRVPPIAAVPEGPFVAAPVNVGFTTYMIIFNLENIVSFH